VVEEAVIVVGVLEREDGLVDEFVDAVDVRDEVRWVFEVHCHCAVLFLSLSPMEVVDVCTGNMETLSKCRNSMRVGSLKL
jgi:hypothetical protein